ncbi:hypothetical protein [Reyranella sp.]|jgi:hypothetical protein|uniref:hypothetical protein n=1 Tax=Reyranella sp. TaxID=1929291 RepID=UPI003D0CAED9
MKKFLLPLCVAFAAAPALAQAPGPLDGEWRGRSDGGSCNAPLEYIIFIESGLVEGTATDATARGPVPNTKKGPPPAPTPGLWQIHGLVKPGGSFSLIAVASVKGTDRREGRLNVTSQGGTLTITERSGCGRTARLSKS